MAAEHRSLEDDSNESMKALALAYHEFPTPGKISIAPTKPCVTAHDLSLAYSPGVAEPCLVIHEKPETVYNYTSKGNLVAVISNGTAILGLGDLGPAASKPVMEGKGVLFKTFADIDVFDIELDCRDADHFIETVAAMAPTFGGINLEDVKAPECFYIEDELKRRLDIPVFHDDQHGTAIISAAGLINALEITKRDLKDVRLVVSGAGASAIACTKMLFNLGLPKENVLLVDSKGVIYKGRSEGMNKQKEEFAVDTKARTLADALKDADVFYGLSSKDLMTPEMLLSMAPNPIVFAMANPDPEIEYNLARRTRKDVILATGRSDHPNQVNNVLGFPFIFRGALDVRARAITEEMKLAATYALANLAKETVTDGVRRAYGNADFAFGPDYLIPKPFDSRVLYYVAPAVAKAAVEGGVARKKIDLEEYTLRLKGKENHGRRVLRAYYSFAREAERKRIALAEGENIRVIRAAAMAHAEGIAEPVLLGSRATIEQRAESIGASIEGLEIIEPIISPKFHDYAAKYYESQRRRGVTVEEAKHRMRENHVFANMLLSAGEVDGVISGVDQPYPPLVREILRIVGVRPGISTAAGLYILSINDKVMFVADTTINIELTSEKLADIAIMTAEFAESMSVEPRIAMLSFSNFGSSSHPLAKLVRDATEIVRKKAPRFQIDGEMQVDAALDQDVMREHYPFCALNGQANVLVFPDMQSGNIAYKLLQRLGGARVVGPIILGLKAPAYVMQQHASVDEIFNMITVAIAKAEQIKKRS